MRREKKNKKVAGTMRFFYLTATMDSSDSPIIEEATKKVNAFTKYWNSINWDALLANFISKGTLLLITFIIIMVIKKIGMTLIRQGFNNYKIKEAYSENRVETLYKLTSNGFQYLLYFILLYTLLTILGVPVGSLIAGAGIAGIAIGLGAQGFINDLLTGFFIILERQIDVGDHVMIDDIEGTVVVIGLRTTQIKSFNGTLHFIPNRNISIVSNLSRENMRALIELRVKPDHDLEQINAIIDQVNQELVPNHPEIKSGPTNLGVADLGQGNLAIKIVMYVKNGDQTRMQSLFLAAYIKAITAAGINLPESPLTIATK